MQDARAAKDRSADDKFAVSASHLSELCRPNPVRRHGGVALRDAPQTEGKSREELLAMLRSLEDEIAKKQQARKAE